MVKECNEKLYSIIGYELVKTLSEHGSVSRGVCKVDEHNYLVAINERTNIYKEGDHIVYEENGHKHNVPSDSEVSMNFWCFHPSLFALGEKMFHDFLKHNISNLKAEFFIPIIGDHLISKGLGKIKVIPTSAQWFGVTYKEDAPGVQQSLDNLIKKGEYPERLWS
jgi:hypothetical protein